MKSAVAADNNGHMAVFILLGAVILRMPATHYFVRFRGA